MLFNRFVKTFVYYKLYKINKHCSAFKVNNIIRGNIKLLSTNRILNNIIHDKGVEYHGPIVWPIIDVNNSDVNNSDVNNSDVNNSDVNNIYNL